MEMNESSSTIDIRKNWEGSSFSKISRLNHMHNYEEMDLLDRIGAIGKPARDLFLKIKYHMNWKTNESTIPKVKSRSESTTRSRALKDLKEYALVKKTGDNSYFVNPYMIIPSGKEREDCITERWNNCDGL